MDTARTLGWTLVMATSLTGCAHTPQFGQNPFTQGARERSLRYDLARVTEREGNVQQAATEYEAQLARDPDNARLCHRLGVARLKLGASQEGITLLQRARQLEPKNADILNDLGFAYLEVGELERAEQEFREALSIKPNDPRTINNLGLCAGYAGRTEEAYSCFRRVGGEAAAQSNLAFVLAQRGDVSASMARYNRALTADPEFRPAAEAIVQLASLPEVSATAIVATADYETIAPDAAPASEQSSEVVPAFWNDIPPSPTERAATAEPVPPAPERPHPLKDIGLSSAD